MGDLPSYTMHLRPQMDIRTGDASLAYNRHILQSTGLRGGSRGNTSGNTKGDTSHTSTSTKARTTGNITVTTTGPGSSKVNIRRGRGINPWGFDNGLGTGRVRMIHPPRGASRKVWFPRVPRVLSDVHRMNGRVQRRYGLRGRNTRRERDVGRLCLKGGNKRLAGGRVARSYALGGAISRDAMDTLVQDVDGHSPTAWGGLTPGYLDPSRDFYQAPLLWKASNQGDWRNDDIYTSGRFHSLKHF
jgi:hypothetical protein